MHIIALQDNQPGEFLLVHLPGAGPTATKAVWKDDKKPKKWCFHPAETVWAAGWGCLGFVQMEQPGELRDPCLGQCNKHTWDRQFSIPHLQNVSVSLIPK